MEQQRQGNLAAMGWLETVAIRRWHGRWQNGPNAPRAIFPPGGYVLTFHRGDQPPYKIEHYDAVNDILDRYPQIAWMQPSEQDASDVVLVGVM